MIKKKPHLLYKVFHRNIVFQKMSFDEGDQLVRSKLRIYLQNNVETEGEIFAVLF